MTNNEAAPMAMPAAVAAGDGLTKVRWPPAREPTVGQLADLQSLADGGRLTPGEGPLKRIWFNSRSNVGMPVDRVMAMVDAGWLERRGDRAVVLSKKGRKEVEEWQRIK